MHGGRAAHEAGAACTGAYILVCRSAPQDLRAKNVPCSYKPGTTERKPLLAHSSTGRIDPPAVLLVGSTPSTCTNVHNASRRFRMSRHVPAVLGTPHRLPASKSRSTSRRSGLM